MANQIDQKTGDGLAPSEAGQIQCHVVPNTHWDREWKFSLARQQFMLVEMMDLLLDVLARAPEIKTFHLDSQTAPLLDYLEMRPEREDDLKALVRGGRLDVGPWYTLPDEFCVGGESLIRNLLLGHRIARRFGRVCKSGYSPFSWGQISQMPQIYRGFGIDVMMFYRGVNTHVAPRSEFIWRGPDGSSIIASRLAARPRYNVWYVLQRPAYWGVKLHALNDFELPWSCGHAPFRMIDRDHGTLDYKLAHPKFEYDGKVLNDACQQAIREQDDDWSTPHRLWAIGHDASSPDLREVKLIADASRALGDQAAVFFSSMEKFQDAIRSERRDDWPVVTGEMRHPYTRGSASSMLGWIISARSYLKQDNFQAERALTHQAEPLAVFARLLGAEYPTAFINRAYELLLQNHAHDSIGGCGRDVVHDDMRCRFRRVRELSTCVLEQSLMQIAGSIDTSGWSPDDLGVVVQNLTSRPRSDVIELAIDVPADWTGFELIDDSEIAVSTQAISTTRDLQESVYNPHDVSTFLTSNRHHVLAFVEDIPPMGYRTYRVRRSDTESALRKASIVCGSGRLENEYLDVQVNDNGTLRVRDKSTGRVTDGLAYFKDSGASGNPWQHEAPKNDQVFTTLNSKPAISLVREGPLEASIEVRHEWDLPTRLTDDGLSRSQEITTLQLVSVITLRFGQPWLEVTTEFDNRVKDHYLRVCFPTGLQTDRVDVQSSFDVVERFITRPEVEPPDEPHQPEQPMDSFVDVSDGQFGVAILSDGLKAYEACDDPERTINITLLRALAMRFFVPEKFDHAGLADGSQCPGPQRFHYAIMPHAGDWECGGVWRAADRFKSPLIAGQIGVSNLGCEPMRRSFLEIEPQACCLSTVKQSENGQGIVVRVFNPTRGTLDTAIRLNNGVAASEAQGSPTERTQSEFRFPETPKKPWSAIREVTLEESPVRDLPCDKDGWVRFSLSSRKIVTVEFRSDSGQSEANA